MKELGFKGASALWAQHGAIIPDAKSVEGITQTIRWAGEAGIPVVNAGDGKKPKDMSDDDALKLMRERLAQILEVAERSRVYLAIEPHGTFSLTADGLKKIMALSTSKWLGINYDTANVHRATYVETVAGAYSWTPFGKRQDEVVTLASVVDRVVHVHVKDVVGAKCVALGKGEVNLKGCLNVLKRHDYSGVLSLETEGEFSAEEGQKLIEESRMWLLNALTRQRQRAAIAKEFHKGRDGDIETASKALSQIGFGIGFGRKAEREGIRGRQVCAGCSCVRQWTEPSPRSRSTAWMPTTVRLGNNSPRIPSASRSCGSLNVGTSTAELEM